jgi:hypothetical protein
VTVVVEMVMTTETEETMRMMDRAGRTEKITRENYFNP